MYLKSVEGKILYEGRFTNVRQGVEKAVECKTDLTGINLRGANLAGGSFDDAHMPKACLWGANLTDANFTQSHLEGSDFRASTLLNTCFAKAECGDSNFEGAYFARTILIDADLHDCSFSCPSLFQVNLAEAKTLEGAIYSHLGEQECALSNAPLIIKGLMKPMIFMDQHALIGSDLRKTDMRDRILKAVLEQTTSENIIVNQ